MGGAVADMQNVSDASFDRDVIQAELPVLVDFWAEWCRPCLVMAPLLEKLADERRGRLKVVKLDVQSNPLTPAHFGIMNIPTLILFVGGEPKERLTGYMPFQRIEGSLAPHLAE